MSINIDLHNTLCIACSSSLLSEKRVAHITKCCHEVICDACIRANPRLATYHPCLACLGGVGLSASKFQSQKTPPPYTITSDESLFVLGDDSDEDAQEQKTATEDSEISPSPSSLTPPAYQEAVDPENHDGIQLSSVVSLPPEPEVASSVSETLSRSVQASPQKYYINPCDTIHGIALRFGVDARDLCRTNNLPFSTLSTTPHLLHTRVSLTLPPSSKPVPLQYVLSEEDRVKRDAQRSKERAEKRLQMITKEVDWRVAKTYVALVGDPELENAITSTCKEGSDGRIPISKSTAGPSSDSLESRAIDLYLGDEQWEQNELRVGRSPHPPRFSLSAKNPTPSSELSTKGTWRSWIH